MSEWISVKEQFPGLFKSVLVFKGAVYVGSWNGHHWYNGDGGMIFGVTHWMPLPEPPKGAQ